VGLEAKENYERISYNLSFCRWPKPARSLAILGFGNSVTGEWDPASCVDGLAGSEEAIVYLAQELTRITPSGQGGYQVHVYAQPGSTSLWSLPGSNPLYQHADGYDRTELEFDATICWRHADFTRAAKHAKRVYFWPHDLPRGKFELTGLTGCFFLSEFQRRQYLAVMPELADIPYEMCGNGVDPGQFGLMEGLARAGKSDPDLGPDEIGPLTRKERLRSYIKVGHDDSRRLSCVYASNYSRGLSQLLDIWLDVRKEFPTATLDIYYGRETWGTMSKEELDKLTKRIVAFKKRGVRERGKVGHKELAEAFLRSSILTYPCSNLSETFCITAVKAQAAGMIPVVTRKGALDETVRREAPSVEEVNTPQGLQAYKQKLIETMRWITKLDGDKLEDERIEYRVHAMRYEWRYVADAWIKAFNQPLAAVEPVCCEACGPGGAIAPE